MLPVKVSLMQKLAARNHISNDIKAMRQLKQGSSGVWRVCQLYDDCVLPGGSVIVMIRDCLRQAANAQLWEHLEATELQASEVHRLCVRPAAVMFEHVVRKQHEFPTRLLATLTDARQVAACLDVFTDHACLLDEWSKQFLSEHCTREGLVSSDAKQELAAIAAHIITNTMSIESSHSRNLRRARSRAHTFHMALPDVALWTHGWAAPAHVTKPPSQEFVCIGS